MSPAAAEKKPMRFAYSNRAPGGYRMKEETVTDPVTGKTTTVKTNEYVIDPSTGREIFDANFVGGAARVVFESGINAWIAPGKPCTTKEEWESLLKKDETYEPHRFTFKGKNIDLYLFPYVEEDRKKHYRFANIAFWPIHHEMDPFYFSHPGQAAPVNAGNGTHREFHLSKDACKDGFASYEHFNETYANTYIRALREKGIFRKGIDKLDVHDYQCANVTSRMDTDTPDMLDDTFLFHIPLPSMDYLRSICDPARLAPSESHSKYDEVLMQKGGWFNRYIDNIIDNHAVINCQRPGDQEKLLKLIAYFHPQVAVDNLEFDTDSERGIHPQKQGKSGVISLDVRDILPDGSEKHRKIKIVNIPVGTSQKDNLQEAQDYDHLFHIKRRSAGLRQELPEDQLGADYKPQLFTPAKLAAGGIVIQKDRPLTAAGILRDVLLPGKGFMINAHRDDPSKDALAQIEAAKILYQERPLAKKMMPFVLFVGPSRDEIDEYKAYHQVVLAKARELKADPEFSKAFIIIPEEIRHGELMGLLRHPNMKIKLDAAPWDGHALTAREPADVRIDWTRTQLEDNPPAVIMPTGIGASDVLGGSKKNPGAIIYDTHSDHQQYIRSMANAMIQAFDLQYERDGTKNEAGRKELADRYEVMAKASKKYSGKFYGKTVHSVSDGEVSPKERPLVHSSMVWKPIPQGIIDRVKERSGRSGLE